MLHVENGNVTIGGYSLPEHGTGLVTYRKPTLHKCSFEFNKVGDKISYKIYLDITTTINEVDHHQVIKAEYAGTPEGVPVKGVKVEPTMELRLGNDKEYFRYRIEPYDAKNQNVTITSSDDSVASVEKSVYEDPYMGVEIVEYYVIQHKVGTATITVITEDGGHTAECEVTVLPSLIDVTPHEVIIDTEGGSFTIDITTDEDWLVDNGWQFVDYEQRSGSGDATITVKIPESTSSYENIHYIEIKTTGDIYDSDTVWVKQPAADE